MSQGRGKSKNFIFTRLCGLVALTFACTAAVSQTVPQPPSASPTGNTNSAHMHYRPNRVAKRAGEYYGVIWGVDSLRVKAAESGVLIRFSYRVLDSEKAKILNDKRVEAFLDAPAVHARLVVPSLEKVGQLRQSTTEEAGKSYWMAFSNPRRTVRRGDRVNIVIGQFHADDLVVE